MVVQMQKSPFKRGVGSSVRAHRRSSWGISAPQPAKAAAASKASSNSAQVSSRDSKGHAICLWLGTWCESLWQQVQAPRRCPLNHSKYTLAVVDAICR